MAIVVIDAIFTAAATARILTFFLQIFIKHVPAENVVKLLTSILAIVSQPTTKNYTQFCRESRDKFNGLYPSSVHRSMQELWPIEHRARNMHFQNASFVYKLPLFVYIIRILIDQGFH